MSKSSLRHIRDGRVLLGIVWREMGAVGWVWFAETALGRMRDFPTEEAAETWLRGVVRKAA